MQPATSSRTASPPAAAAVGAAAAPPPPGRASSAAGPITAIAGKPPGGGNKVVCAPADGARRFHIARPRTADAYVLARPNCRTTCVRSAYVAYQPPRARSGLSQLPTTRCGPAAFICLESASSVAQLLFGALEFLDSSSSLHPPTCATPRHQAKLPSLHTFRPASTPPAYPARPLRS